MGSYVFPNCPSIRPMDTTNQLWQLDDHFSCQVSGLTVRIKKGFVTDGVSIPRLFWRVIGSPLQLPLLPAALVHDALYAAELVTRAQADLIFLELMQALGIGWIKRRLIYMAVRAGGGFVWENHTSEGVAEDRKYVTVTRSR